MAGTAGLPASVSADWRDSKDRLTYAAAAKSYNVPLSSFWHRVHGRRSRNDARIDRQYLTPSEEKALRDCVLHRAALGQYVTVKLLRYLAREIVCRRTTTFQTPATDNKIRLPGKNWPQGFYKRHPDLRTRTLKPIEWDRHNIYDKVVQWFDIIEKELQNPAILPGNVYNADETGITLSRLTNRKVIMHKNDSKRFRGVGSKRRLVTAIECISADGRCLDPLIIWPTSTIRSDWTTHPTPNWHFTCSSSGYSNSQIMLEWFQLVFDPQTRSRANGRPRLLIVDGFGAHESLEALQFCHENNIILCRLPSHTSHKLQPCDVAVFGLLKTAYRERVEELYRGGAKTVAFTIHNITSAWAASGLYPPGRHRVLNGIPKPPRLELNKDHPTDVTQPDEMPYTPVTSEGLVSLRRKLEQNIDGLDEEDRLYFCKLANAGERAMTARDLLFKENHDLFQQNNESTTRASRNSAMVGKGKVMSYDDIVQAQKKRDEKASAKKGRPGRKRKNVVRTARQRQKSRADEVEEAMDEIKTSGMEKYCFVF